MKDKIKEKFGRNKFFRLLGLGVGIAVSKYLWSKIKTAQYSVNLEAKKRFGMVIDLSKCIGCEACTVACKMENNAPIASPGDNSRRIAWQEVIRKKKGDFPYVEYEFLPRPCMHCEDPPCVRVCPVGATYQNDDGLVLQRYNRCIGCRYCAVACPYGVRYFNWATPKFSHQRESNINPLVPKRQKGVVEKCTYCSHRIELAKERAGKENREIKDGEIVPACVEECCNKARYFGDLNDPSSEVSKLARERGAFKLLDELGTNPKTIYLK